MTFAPTLTNLADLVPSLTVAGFAVLDGASSARLAGVAMADFERWRPGWDDLPPDPHLKDGGHYRRRRHGSFVVHDGAVELAAHRAHWQPVEYNALHGGIQRWFEPLAAGWVADPVWHRWLAGLAGVAGQLWPATRWFVEAHPFRIDTTDGIGRPTPEGAHRDGVDLVAVTFVGRCNVKGGETRVFDTRGPHGTRFTLTEPWSTLLLDDARVIHESTPIQPLDPSRPAYRDTLVLTLRRDGFQGPG